MRTINKILIVCIVLAIFLLMPDAVMASVVDGINKNWTVVLQ